MDEQVFEPITLIFCIVNRGVGKEVAELCTREGLSCHLLLRGRGTADNATLAMLGFGEREKDIMLLSVASSRKQELMDKITEAAHLNERGRGIAFSIPFSSMALQMNSHDLFAGKMAAIDETKTIDEDNKKPGDIDG